MSEALRRSLVPAAQAAHERVVVEPRGVTRGGMVIAHGARAQAPLDRYRARGQVSHRQADAGGRLYRLWALGVHGARTDHRGCSPWSPGGFTDGQLDAASGYADAIRALGGRLAPLVVAVCCDEVTVDAWARERQRNPAATMEVLRYSLDMLGDHFGL